MIEVRFYEIQGGYAMHGYLESVKTKLNNANIENCFDGNNKIIKIYCKDIQMIEKALGIWLRRYSGNKDVGDSYIGEIDE